MELPALQARDLEGTDYAVPRGLPGGPHLIILASELDHQAIVERWKDPLTALAAGHPGTAVWALALIPKAFRLMRGSLESSMRKRVADATVRRHTLTACTDVGAVARALGLNLKAVHVLVVRPDGAVLGQVAGAPEPAALATLEALLPA